MYEILHRYSVGFSFCNTSTCINQRYLLPIGVSIHKDNLDDKEFGQKSIDFLGITLQD